MPDLGNNYPPGVTAAHRHFNPPTCPKCGCYVDEGETCDDCGHYMPTAEELAADKADRDYDAMKDEGGRG